VLEIVEGARVRLRDVSGPAKVRRILPNGMLEVEVGLLKMQVPRAEVKEVLPAGGAGTSKLPQGVTFQAGPRWDTLTREINVIGRTAEEAREEVDKFLDSATLAEVNRVRIVHGHGHGILRRTLHEMLSKHPLVARYQLADANEGGQGATIVELKE